MKQRLAVARAVLHRPQVLLLDEPFSGLDVHATEMLAGLLADMAQEGCTILMATHSLGLALGEGQRVVVMHQGRIIHDAQSETIDVGAFPGLYQDLTS
jgi:ABC-type multidrug transport system ATPase subunit